MEVTCRDEPKKKRIEQFRLPSSQHRTDSVPEIHDLPSRSEIRPLLPPVDAQEVTVAIAVDDSMEQVTL